jgi:hypothetical protein
MNARKNLLKYHVASETIASRYHGNRVRSVRNADRSDFRERVRQSRVLLRLRSMFTGSGDRGLTQLCPSLRM